MTWIVMAFALVIGAVLQTVLPAWLFLGQAKFPVLLALVLYYALNRDTPVMLVAAVFAGFLQDILSIGIPLGYSSCCFIVAGWLVGRFRQLVIMDSMLTPVFFGGVAGSVLTLVMYMLLCNAGAAYWPLGMLFLKIAGAGLLGVAVTPVVFLAAQYFDGLMGIIEVKENLDAIE